MEKLNLNNCKVNEKFEGDVGVKLLQLALTKNGDYYLTGSFINGTDVWQYKVWDKGLINKGKQMVESITGFQPFVAHVKGRVDEFNGNPSFIVTEMISLDTEDYSEFLPTLDVAGNYNKFKSFIDNHIGTNYAKVIYNVLGIDIAEFTGKLSKQGTTVNDLLVKGWAASGNHDAIQGGLVNHTYKMLRIAYTVMENNPRLAEKKDLIYTGIILHDIGKTQEIFNGVYTRNAFVSHRVMGIEYLASIKSFVVDKIGIDDYYRLLDILIGHHDEFEQKAKTAWGYLVHLIDMLDTWATIIEDEYSSDMYATNQCGEHTFRLGDKFLTI